MYNLNLLVCNVRGLIITESEHNSHKNKNDNPFVNGSYINTVVSALKNVLRNISESEWFRNVMNNWLSLIAKIRRAVSSESLNLVKEELSMYYRLEQYACYLDINDAKNYIQKSIDNYKNILINKKNEPITVNGEELTYGEYISQLSEDQLEIFVQILHKKASDSLTYGDIQKLSQTINAQKKQGGTAFLLDCEDLPGDSSDVTNYTEEIQKFINQKQEDLIILDKIACLDDIEVKIKQLEKELKLFCTEDTLNDLLASCKPEIIYPPAEKQFQKYDDLKDIVYPISATEYRVITEHDGIISAVYAGKTQTSAKTYYRSASGHFYNQSGHEEKPSELYNADKTLKAEIIYTSEENDKKILKETDFFKDENKTISSETRYKYDINGKFIMKITEVFDTENKVERYYFNQAGMPCKYEKEYEQNGINYRDVYGGKINDVPYALYKLINNKWEKA